MVDGQPITDQQSKVFSNQIPLDSIASKKVISGAPPAEFGEKTSVVINATTRSGQGLTTPTGSVTTSYGSFGTSTVGINVGYGGPKWGNFISTSGLNTGRFLDPPEFTVIHAKGRKKMSLTGLIISSQRSRYSSSVIFADSKSRPRSRSRNFFVKYARACRNKEIAA